MPQVTAVSDSIRAALQAQVDAADSVVQAVSATPSTVPWSATTMMTLSIALLVFGIIVLLLITSALRRGRDPHQTLQAFAVPLIIVAAVFLVVAGYSEHQISPVIGLLGTLAGYLLGRNSDGSRRTAVDLGHAAPPLDAAAEGALPRGEAHG